MAFHHTLKIGIRAEIEVDFVFKKYVFAMSSFVEQVSKQPQTFSMNYYYYYEINPKATHTCELL